MRLVSISMVRNEADLIEIFVRHHIEIVDRMILIDHRSIDRTPEILESLRAEGAPIEIIRHSDPVMVQTAVTSLAMHKAAAEQAADWLLPLDADEFLASDTEQDVRSLFEKLPPDEAHWVPWRTYVPRPEDDPSEARLFDRIQHRRLCEVSPIHKVLVPGSLARDESTSIGIGNHFVERAGKRIERTENHDLPGAFLAHFPLRSVEQLTAKGLVGWLARVPAPDHIGGMGYHLKKLFDRVMSSGEISRSELRDFALAYAIKRGEVPSELELAPIRSPRGLVDLRYSDGSYDLDVLRAVVELAGDLGEQLFEERKRSIWSRVLRR